MLQDEGAGGETSAGELRRAARALQGSLEELEARLWDPPGSTKGIVRSDKPYRRIDYVIDSLGSSWDAPTPAQQAYLEAAEAQTEEVLLDLNRIFAEEVSGFRSQVEAVGLSFLEPLEPLELPAR